MVSHSWLLGVKESPMPDEIRNVRKVTLDTILGRITMEMTSSLHLREVLHAVTQGLVDDLDAAFARIWLVGPGDLCADCFKAADCANRERCLHLEASAGMYTNLNGEYRRIPLGALKIGRIAQGEGRMCTNDVLNEERLPNKQWLRENRLQSFCGYPLVFRGELLGVVAMFSRRMMSEEEFDRLAIFANQAAIAIKNAQLFESAKLAEVAALLGDIGHDIKNMLMPILSGADLLQKDLDEYFGGLSPKETDRSKPTQAFSLEILAMIRTGARRIQDRVREIADAVKGAKSPLQVGPCQLAPVVASVFESLRVLANEKGVHFRTEGLDDLPTIQADEPRLFTAFYNLINNAIPEVPRGGTVTVRGHIDSQRKAVIVTITDTGRGMPPAMRDSLFTNRVVSRKAGGTGLGTKIVKDVVDAHEGSIAVESEEGKGTTFRLQLPIAGPTIPTEGRSSAPVMHEGDPRH